MKLIIKNTEIVIKSKMRAYLIYEQLTNKSFNPKTFTEMSIYFYSLIIANAPDLQFTFDEFMDYLDEQPEIIEQFTEWLITDNKMKNQFSDLKKNKAENL